MALLLDILRSRAIERLSLSAHLPEAGASLSQVLPLTSPSLRARTAMYAHLVPEYQTSSLQFLQEIG